MSDRIRECGPCTACCGVLAVPELGKGTFDACAHVCAGGCGIYVDRPRSCRTFECEWLRGVLEVDGAVDVTLRPDSCGVIFHYRPEPVLGEMFMAWEVEPGAAARGPAREVLDGLVERFLVVLVSPVPGEGEGRTERGLFGPPDVVARATARTWGPG